MKASLSSLRTLTVLPSTLQLSESLNAIFVDVLLFSKLSLAHANWVSRAHSSKPYDYRSFISEAYKFSPDSTSVTALQIENISKNKTKNSLFEQKPNFKNQGAKRSFSKRNQTAKSFKPRPPNRGQVSTKPKVKCFSCGRLGHKASQCRGAGHNNNKKPPQ